MPREAVSNTSPLLNLALIDHLELLEDQFETVKMPRQVWEELEEGEKGLEKLEELSSTDLIETVEVEEDELFREIVEDIDKGEAAALRYTLEADTDLVLLDEKEGREVARRHNLNTTGVIGILLKASKTGEIELETEIRNLRKEGFYISDGLVEEILEEK
ncbi:MAG: DUF3368 domain-containing protein [Candidatus Aenigmatarchaeota archaeon]